MCHAARLENPGHQQLLLEVVGRPCQLRHPRDEHPQQ